MTLLKDLAKNVEDPAEIFAETFQISFNVKSLVDPYKGCVYNPQKFC